MAKRKIKAKTEPNASLTYAGEVTVSLVKNNKVYSTKKFKNNGRTPLFKFFSECLAGNIKEVSTLRPQYVELFHIGDAGTSALDLPSFSTLAQQDNVRTLQSVLYSGAINVETTSPTSSSEGESAATFKFLIPMNIVNYESGAINMCAIYSSSNKPNRGGLSVADFTKASAYYIVVDDNNPDVLGSLIPSGLSADEIATYSVLIQWKMILRNK